MGEMKRKVKAKLNKCNLIIKESVLKMNRDERLTVKI
jgi:hypothetical protein